MLPPAHVRCLVVIPPNQETRTALSTERQFNEREIHAILKKAAEDDQPVPPHADGLTLAELAQIGKEAGISTEAIGRAAASLDVTAPASSSLGTSIGVPLMATRSADLGSSFLDGDWDRLVVDLQQTFRVPGETRLFGELREWKTDDLTVLVEPTQSGHSICLRAVNPLGKAGLIGGAVLFAMGLFFTLLVAAKAGNADLAKLLFTSMFSIVGVGGMAYSSYQSRRWSTKMERHMEEVARRAVEKSGIQPEALKRQPGGFGGIDSELLSDLEDEERPGTTRRTRT